jgi:hypothetical protein
VARCAGSSAPPATQASALPPVGIYILAEHLYSDRLIRHEQAHWRQWQRMGTIRFYTEYLWGLLRHGYRNHPMEIEARGEEDGAQ